MASVVIRNLSEATHNAIKFRARAAGRSTEAEIRLIWITSPKHNKLYVWGQCWHQ
ncbi:trafficking protein A [Neisseria gonorrhoeae]|uniref:Trafficking protein A n=1 Tax=Neisseria gonorrhoeae TaxID=485 RepID=A0A378VYH6_NEIGO|nr:trafficking protein A [Neisseria gonorrhoeae]